MRTTGVLLAAVLGFSPPLAAQAIGRDSAFGPVSPDLVAGRRVFESQCARCHGAGGTGGVGPALDRPRLRRAPTDEALAQVIVGGIPGTAMIGFWNLTEQEAAQVAGYVRALGRRPPEVIPGDSARGAALYAGSGGCGSCHILDGVGAGWAPDLSDVGLRLGARQLRAALTDPGATQAISPLPSVHGPYPGWLVVEATTATGRVFRGTRVTEDDFTLVLREADGHLRSLDKTALRRLRKFPGQSPMPSYATLTPSALDDLIAFLASHRGPE